jgi:type I restriction enzyme S subunit
MSFPCYPAYKDSGVEWLGEVPEHWDLMRLSRKLENMPCYGVLVPEYVDDGVPMLRINDIENGLASRDDLKKISTQLSDEYSRTLLEEGDIALAVVGTIGRSLIVDK